MDSNLISAFIGLGGGLIGVGVGAYFQRRVTHSQLCRETTMHLYDRLDDSDIMESRIRAEQILAANAASERPKPLSELYETLSREEWRHIARTRHFLDQIGLLSSIGYLDPLIARPLFKTFVQYWVERYFDPLEALEPESLAKRNGKGQQWLVTSRELRKFFS